MRWEGAFIECFRGKPLQWEGGFRWITALCTKSAPHWLITCSNQNIRNCSKNKVLQLSSFQSLASIPIPSQSLFVAKTELKLFLLQRKLCWLESISYSGTVLSQDRSPLNSKFSIDNFSFILFTVLPFQFFTRAIRKCLNLDSDSELD